MKMAKALALSLGDSNQAVITRYDLGMTVFRLYREKRYRGEAIALQKETADKADFNKYLEMLRTEGVLVASRDLPPKVYSLLGNTRWNPEEVACVADPFAYISHLSAMEYHGLTDRIPSKLFLSSPAVADWKVFAEAKMAKDLKDDFLLYREQGFPLLVFPKLTKIGKVEVAVTHSKHHGAFKKPQNSNIRVATMGRTFLDMLRRPELCGGINHVLQVFDQYASTYFKLIRDEVNQHGTDIDKVRAGYILEERLGIEDSVVDSWAQFAQRGGSRKLDAAGEFVAKWSDKWMLSLNTFEKVS